MVAHLTCRIIGNVAGLLSDEQKGSLPSAEPSDAVNPRPSKRQKVGGADIADLLEKPSMKPYSTSYEVKHVHMKNLIYEIAQSNPHSALYS